MKQRNLSLGKDNILHTLPAMKSPGAVKNSDFWTSTLFHWIKVSLHRTVAQCWITRLFKKQDKTKQNSPLQVSFRSKSDSLPTLLLSAFISTQRYGLRARCFSASWWLPPGSSLEKRLQRSCGHLRRFSPLRPSSLDLRSEELQAGNPPKVQSLCLSSAQLLPRSLCS